MTNEPIASQTSRRTKTRKLLLALLKAVITAVILYYVGLQLISNWDSVKAYPWHLNWVLLVASVAAHLVTFALFSYFWCILMVAFGYRVPLQNGFKIAYIANLGRYVPGRIWPMFGMIYVARQMKIDERAAVASWLIALLYGIPPSFVVALIALLIYPEQLNELGNFRGSDLAWITVLVMVFSALLILLPNKAIAIGNKVLRRFGRKPVTCNLTVGRALLVFSGYALCWASYGIAFWLFTLAISGDRDVPVVPSVGAFVLAYQAGYFMIFTPAGLGTRELVLYAMLKPYLGPAASGIAVAARIWNTVSDIIASVIALRIRPRPVESLSAKATNGIIEN